MLSRFFTLHSSLFTKKILHSSLFTLHLLLLIACSSGGDDDTPAPEPIMAQRTVIAYLDGNQTGINSLVNVLEKNKKDMETGSKQLSEDVNLVVFANIRGQKPYISKLENGYEKKVRQWDNDFLAVNPDSMLSVMQWIIKEYPAQEYAAIFAGHGSGSLTETDTIATTLRPAYAYGFDNSQKRSIWINTQTLATVMSHLPHMRFIFFDCCLMQDLDLARQLRKYTDYIISPVTETPSSGAPYSDIVPLLSMPADETLCDTIVATYRKSSSICISALRTSGIDDLTAAVSAALSEVKANLGEGVSIPTTYCIYYYRVNRYAAPAFYDIRSIFYELYLDGDLSEPTYQNFLNALDQCVFSKRFATTWLNENDNINFNDFQVTSDNYGGLGFRLSQ